MQRNLAIISIIWICSFGLSFTVGSTQLLVGVQNGDWIEYNVISTGAPMQGHDVEWARMEITDVQSPNISVIITSRFTDGSNDTINSILNLETGHLIDDFIIPANLNVGDTFKDENYGNITISFSEVRTYAGSQRTVLSAKMGNSTYYWDKATGVSVEGSTHTNQYSIYSVIADTNMWHSTQVQYTDLGATIMIVVIILIIIVLLIAGVVRYQHKKPIRKAFR
jgi:hypothetical protein